MLLLSCPNSRRHVVCAVALLVLAAAPLVTAEEDVEYADVLDGLYERADLTRRGPAGDRAAMAGVLEGAGFLHEEVGPFDLWVSPRDGLSEADVPWSDDPEMVHPDRREDGSEEDGAREENEKVSAAQTVLALARDGLAALTPVMERHFGRESGLVSGQRFDVVLVWAERAIGDSAFDEVTALVDWCDRGGSQWTEANGTLWTDVRRDALTLNTWDVLAVNLAHPVSRDHGSFFVEHGLGYHVLATLVNKVLRKGSWGSVPPWVAQGLVDELDIQAYGDAWVGGDWFEEQTEGWYRPGWSGFLPTGHSPPPQPTGPPADLAVTVSDTGDPWAHRNNSPDRHWDELVADRESDAPASFQYMAEHESFLPRDRAYARCVLHMVLELAPMKEIGFFEPMDVELAVPPTGMPESHPLPAVMAALLGGLPEVNDLELLPLREVLLDLGREDLIESLEALGAGGALEIPDHRDQAQWLYDQSEYGMAERRQVFDIFLEAEYYQQLHEWWLIGARLDDVVDAVFSSFPAYPADEAAREDLADAFWRELRKP